MNPLDLKPNDPLTRRNFIKTGSKGAAAAAIGSLAAPNVLRGASPVSKPIGIGLIGVGTRGNNLVHIFGSRKACKVVALCDVYKPHLRRGIERCGNPEAKTYLDYRDLLSDPKVEAVVIATPDHWHEHMLLDAVHAGKDVYCEKGWATSVEAAKRMRSAIKKAGTVMQLGHQGRQYPAADVARELVLEGKIGDITMAKVGRFFNKSPDQPPWRWYSDYSNYERPDPKQVVKDLDWERWLGPAPKIEFNERHFWHWRCYWPYGTGQAGDLLSHEMDCIQSIFRYGIPDTCNTAAHNAFWKDDRETPDTWISSFVFKKRNFTVVYEGCMNSSRMQTPELIGRKGRIIFDEVGQFASMFEVYSDERAYTLAVRPSPKPTFFFEPGKKHRKPGHADDFLNCIRTREPPQCNEDEALIETATFMMAVESLKQKRQVRWDPEREDIV